MPIVYSLLVHCFPLDNDNNEKLFIVLRIDNSLLRKTMSNNECTLIVTRIDNFDGVVDSHCLPLNNENNGKKFIVWVIDNIDGAVESHCSRLNNDNNERYVIDMSHC